MVSQVMVTAYLHHHGSVLTDTSTWSKLADGTGCIERPGSSVGKRRKKELEMSVMKEKKVMLMNGIEKGALTMKEKMMHEEDVTCYPMLHNDHSTEDASQMTRCAQIDF